MIITCINAFEWYNVINWLQGIDFDPIAPTLAKTNALRGQILFIVQGLVTPSLFTMSRRFIFDNHLGKRLDLRACWAHRIVNQKWEMNDFEKVLGKSVRNEYVIMILFVVNSTRNTQNAANFHFQNQRKTCSFLPSLCSLCQTFQHEQAMQPHVNGQQNNKRKLEKRNSNKQLFQKEMFHIQIAEG